MSTLGTHLPRSSRWEVLHNHPVVGASARRVAWPPWWAAPAIATVTITAPSSAILASSLFLPRCIGQLDTEPVPSHALAIQIGGSVFSIPLEVKRTGSLSDPSTFKLVLGDKSMMMRKRKPFYYTILWFDNAILWQFVETKWGLVNRRKARTRLL